MRHMIWTLALVLTVGVFAYQAGLNAQTTVAPEVLTMFETQPHVVLAKTGTRQQQARERKDGCEVTKGDVGQQETKEREGSIMKGLVF